MTIFTSPPDATFEVVMNNTNWQPIFSLLGLEAKDMALSQKK